MVETKISHSPSKEEIISTQQAADFLQFSHEYLLQLLEDEKIPYKTIEGEKRLVLSDVTDYEKEFKAHQKKLLIEMMQEDEDNNMYE